MRWRRKGAEAPAEEQALDDPAPAAADPSDVTDGDGAVPQDDGDEGDTAMEAAAATGARDHARRPDLDVDTGVVEEGELARAVRRAVARAMAEDLGDRGDVTSLATVAPTRRGMAELVARADGVFCGGDVVQAVFGQVDARIEVALDVTDGDRVRRGQVLGTVSGPLRSILTGERTALNFACHLSGIATRTRAVVDAVEGTGVAVRDTRKTTPGLRLLEKHAVKAGGGNNHRIGLYDALLVKDNHVAAAGSIEEAARAALDRARGRRVQVEVTSVDELRTVLDVGVTDVLLDNFDPKGLAEAVGVADGRARLEASGNITIDNVRAHAESGVDRVAMGSITHSAPWLDLALDVRAAPVEPVDRLGALAGRTGSNAAVPASALLVDADGEPATDTEEAVSGDDAAAGGADGTPTAADGDARDGGPGGGAASGGDDATTATAGDGDGRAVPDDPALAQETVADVLDVSDVGDALLADDLRGDGPLDEAVAVGEPARDGD